MIMSENNDIENEEVFRFRYNEDITKLPAIEEKYFFSRTIDVFRTIITAPPTDKDITPNVYRYENENHQPVS